MRVDFTDKDSAQGKTLRHLLKIGMTEAKGVGRLTVFILNYTCYTLILLK